jgi:hypothetical protein
MPQTHGARLSDAELDPSHIMEVGAGFWPAKTLLSAVELDLFSHLGAESMSGDDLGARPRSSLVSTPAESGCSAKVPAVDSRQASHWWPVTAADPA